MVNAKETDVQGVKSYPSVHDIPETELAIISIPSKSCPEVMEVLARQKGVKAFIVISAGFGEETHEGGILEQQMLDVVNGSFLDRPELYRVDEYELSWRVYATDTGIPSRWRGFHL